MATTRISLAGATFVAGCAGSQPLSTREEGTGFAGRGRAPNVNAAIYASSLPLKTVDLLTTRVADRESNGDCRLHRGCAHIEKSLTGWRWANEMVLDRKKPSTRNFDNCTSNALTTNNGKLRIMMQDGIRQSPNSSATSA